MPWESLVSTESSARGVVWCGGGGIWVVVVVRFNRRGAAGWDLGRAGGVVY